MKSAQSWTFAVILFASPSIAEEPALRAPAPTDNGISDEIKAVLAGFERQRELESNRRKQAIADLKSGRSLSNNKNVEAALRYQKFSEFYANNPGLSAKREPNYGVPRGADSQLRREVDRMHAEAVEAATRAAKKEAKAEIKRLEAAGRKMANQIFVPVYAAQRTSLTNN